MQRVMQITARQRPKTAVYALGDTFPSDARRSLIACNQFILIMLKQLNAYGSLTEASSQ